MAIKKRKKGISKHDFVTCLKAGDPVMVITGGNKKHKSLKGQVGKILKVIGRRSRVVVEGVNIIKRHKRAASAKDTSGIIEKEGSVHVSNVMYYSELLKKPVRLRVKHLEDGKKVRGYTHPETKKFEQIDVA